MAESVLDGFDHTQHRAEVERRWGEDAYARSDSWWRGLGEQDRQEWLSATHELGRDWVAAARTPGLSAGSAPAQDLARRHIEWLRGIPGTPAAERGGDLNAYVRALADSYVSDERFAASYGGAEGATFVRDALLAHLERTA